ncbi:hypothetical protein BH23GEM10_BH23GEM10_03220 [soil metagenome]
MNDELFRANRFDLISRLADDLAHEIKNPLNAIVINLEVLKVRLGRGDADAALDRAAVIEEETRRLHALIDRMLQLLRQTRDDGGSLALDQVLDEVLPLFAAQMRLAHNEFSCEGGAEVYVAVSRDLFKFALLNVLTAVHDRLGERNGRIVLQCETDDATVTLSIHPIARASMQGSDASIDDAVGIAGALLAHAGGTVSAAGDGVTIVLPRGT